MIRFLHRVRLSVWRIVDPIEKLSSRNNCTHLFIALEAFNDELANFPYKIAAIPAEQVPKMQFMNHDLSARGQLLLLVFGRHTQKTSIGYTRCCCRRVKVLSVTRFDGHPTECAMRQFKRQFIAMFLVAYVLVANVAYHCSLVSGVLSGVENGDGFANARASNCIAQSS